MTLSDWLEASLYSICIVIPSLEANFRLFHIIIHFSPSHRDDPASRNNLALFAPFALRSFLLATAL